jgi:hypothetical protein
MSEIMSKLMLGLIGVIIFVVAIKIIGAAVADTTSYPVDLTSAARAPTKYNITLDEGADCHKLLSVRNSSTVDKPANYLASNKYTDFCSSAGKVQIVSNTSIGSTYTVYYEYDDGTTITGVSAVLVGLIVLIIVVGFIVGFSRDWMGGKK